MVSMKGEKLNPVLKDLFNLGASARNKVEYLQSGSSISKIGKMAMPFLIRLNILIYILASFLLLLFLNFSRLLSPCDLPSTD